ncbi:MAG: hypothetical protein ABSE73_22640, partial [Planctomycetota bacterium]
MATGVNTRELLGAYLCGDVTPEERVAVEQLLAADGAAQAEARELQALRGVLSHGERAAGPALISTLRLRVEQACAGQARELAVAPQALPAAMPGFAEFLKQGERPVSDALAKKLAEQLSAALPSAGIGRMATAQRQSRREATPTVRVYAVPRNPWRARLAWAGAAAAALVMLGVGLARLLERGPGRAGGPSTDDIIANKPANEANPARELPRQPGNLVR